MEQMLNDLIILSNLYLLLLIITREHVPLQKSPIREVYHFHYICPTRYDQNHFNFNLSLSINDKYTL
jgi:hypothetical protein